MKKFVLRVMLFFACVAVMDFAFSLIFSYLRAHAKGGSTANCEYIANRCQDDIIILGSSRATHHYVPQIIEDSLGVTCYNCGEEGNGVILAYGRLKMLTERYTPKLVLYELTPDYDYGKLEPNNKYLGYLRAYYYKDGIKEVFKDFDDDLSSLKMMSGMYRNTGRILPVVFDNITYRDNQKGFEALNGVMKPTQEKPNEKNNVDICIDSLKLYYVEKVIDLCQSKQIPICFMISPRYGMVGVDMTNYYPGIELCKRHNVPVYNFIACPSISDHPDFFQDGGHMNSLGAVAFTSLLVDSVLQNNF